VESDFRILLELLLPDVEVDLKFLIIKRWILFFSPQNLTNVLKTFVWFYKRNCKVFSCISEIIILQAPSIRSTSPSGHLSTTTKTLFTFSSNS